MGFFLMGMVLWGFFAGWIAQLLLGKGRKTA